MSSPFTRTPAAKPARRIRTRVLASVATITMAGGAALATAAPANAMPRSCNDIANTMLFFQLAMEMDTGPYARFYASDSRHYDQQVRLWYGSYC